MNIYKELNEIFERGKNEWGEYNSYADGDMEKDIAILCEEYLKNLKQSNIISDYATNSYIEDNGWKGETFFVWLPIGKTTLESTYYSWYDA